MCSRNWSRFDTTANGVAVSGSYAYIADYASGLQIIDLTNLQSSQIVGSVQTPEQAFGVAVSDNHAYVADNASGLHIIDITNPQSPQLVGGVDTPGHATGVTVSGKHVYVADGGSGLQVLPLQCSTPTGVLPNSGSGDAVQLFDLYPNPAKARVVIPFVASRGEPVRLTVHDVAGRVVACVFEGALRPGSGQRIWSVDPRWKLAAGVYVVRLATEHGVQSRKVVLVDGDFPQRDRLEPRIRPHRTDRRKKPNLPSRLPGRTPYMAAEEG